MERDLLKKHYPRTHEWCQHITSLWKETHEHEKRPIYMKRDLYTWKETYERDYLGTHGRRGQTVSCWKRDLYIWKEIYIYGKRPIKKTLPRDSWMVQTNSIILKRDLYTWQETHIHGKRPIYMKRDLLKRQHLRTHGRCRQTVSFRKKRPTYMETDLYTWKETC